LNDILNGSYNSPLSNGVTVKGGYTLPIGRNTTQKEEDCVAQTRSFRFVKSADKSHSSVNQIMKALKLGPLPAAMSIPDCNDGNYYRGGNTG
jgi:hypothetical protein